MPAGARGPPEDRCTLAVASGWRAQPDVRRAGVAADVDRVDHDALGVAADGEGPLVAEEYDGRPGARDADADVPPARGFSLARNDRDGPAVHSDDRRRWGHRIEPWKHRRDRANGLERLDALRHGAAVGLERRRRVVEQVALCCRPHADEADLRGNLAGAELVGGAVAHAIRCEAGPHMAGQRILPEPPIEQRGKALLRRIDRPVELRGEVVHPSLLEPLPRVGVQGRVRIEAVHARWIPWPPDAER